MSEGVPPAAVTLMAFVAPLQIVPPTGWVVILGSATTVTFMDVVAALQVTGSPPIVEVVTRRYHVLTFSTPSS